MNLETYGRQLLNVLAERSLTMLQSTSPEEVRRVLRGELPAVLSERAAMTERTTSSEMSTLGVVGAALGIFAMGAAVGAGVTALTTSSTGPELQKRIRNTAQNVTKQARKEAQQLRAEVESTITHGVEQVASAVGLTSPPAPKSKAKGKSMNGHTPPRRTKKSPSRRAAHA